MELWKEDMFSLLEKRKSGSMKEKVRELLECVKDILSGYPVIIDEKEFEELVNLDKPVLMLSRSKS